jgi:hypothetical protein
MTELVALAAYGVLNFILGIATAAAVQSAIERRREHHTHAPDPPWPTRPANRRRTNGVHSKS